MSATQKGMSLNYQKNRVWAENLTIVLQLGLTMAGCITFCFFVGLYLDRWLGLKGVFITIFTILGIIGGGNVAYRQILETLQENESPEKVKNNDSD